MERSTLDLVADSIKLAKMFKGQAHRVQGIIELCEWWLFEFFKAFGRDSA